MNRVVGGIQVYHVEVVNGLDCSYLCEGTFSA